MGTVMESQTHRRNDQEREGAPLAQIRADSHLGMVRFRAKDHHPFLFPG